MSPASDSITPTPSIATTTATAMSVTSLLASVLAIVLLSCPLTTVSLPNPPSLQPGDDASLLNLLGYWSRADNSYSKSNSSMLLSASALLFNYTASPTVDSIAAASSPAILNFRSLYDFWAPYKKYIVGRGLALQTGSQAVSSADFVAFLAAAMNDYSTLDQVTVQTVLVTMQKMMSSGALWNATDPIGADPSVLSDATFVLQQCYHATSLAQAELSNVSIAQTKPPASTSTASYTYTVTGVNSGLMFNTTDAALSTLLDHLLTAEPHPFISPRFGQIPLNYGRSLTAAVARVELPINGSSSMSISTPYDFSTSLTIAHNAYPTAAANTTLYVEMAQVDGWGDRISFDLFPTVRVSLSSDNKALAPTPTYSAGTVSLTFQYTQQNCDDGWVNSGRFRFSVGATTGNCALSCAKYVSAQQDFSNATMYVTQGTWNKLNNTIQCNLTGPGYYTVLKDNLPVATPNTTRTDGIVTVRATLKSLPTSLDNMTQLMQLAASDVTYLLDVPPTRINVTAINPQAVNASAGDVDVEFQILGATDASSPSSTDLFEAFVALSIGSTSHTDRFLYMAPSSTSCLLGCSGSSGGGMSHTEIVAIAVVVGFFGTIIVGVLLALCCVQMKYWYDRHDFRPAQVDEEDTELGGVGAASEYGGAMSARQRKEESKKRRSTRVSWYNKQDIESAAAYTYSRNSRSNSASESGKAPVFRVRSDSRGSVDGDDLKLDDVEVVGGVEEVSLDDLAEIGIVLDGQQNAADEDSYVMDGHKVKAVKQVHEVDADNVDDSHLARSRSASQLSEYSRNSQSEAGSREGSVNSRNSVSAAGEAPLSVQYQGEDPNTPHTPRTPGGGKKAFYYNKEAQ